VQIFDLKVVLAALSPLIVSTAWLLIDRLDFQNRRFYPVNARHAIALQQNPIDE
jgi:hypothetical protein